MRLRDFFRFVTGRKTDAELEMESLAVQAKWHTDRRIEEEKKKKMLEDAKLQILAQNPQVFGIAVGPQNIPGPHGGQIPPQQRVKVPKHRSILDDWEVTQDAS